MSTDGRFELESIRMRGVEFLVGGRFYTAVPDDQRLERAPSGLPKPYAVLHLGTIYAQTDDRTIMGEEDQPHVMPFSVACYATSADAARSIAGSVRDLFIGWTPSPGSEPITAPGASSYRDRDAAGTPTLFVEVVGLETVINVGSNDGSVPTPGSAPGGSPIDTIAQIVAGLLGEAVAQPVRYDFPTPVAEWPMPHSFGRIPAFRAYALDGTRMLAGEVATLTDVNVSWAQPQAGFAILS